METGKLISASPLTDFLYHKSVNMSIPLSGTFELTPTCNFSCKMCYVRKTDTEVRNSVRKQMTLDQWLKMGHEAAEAGMLYLLLTGGEPTRWPDFWTLYEQLVQMGILISINTNGSLIDETAVGRFVKNPPRKVNITLYGASDETYFRLCGAKNVFRKVDYAINALKTAGIQVKLNCSLTPWNMGDLKQMVDYAEERQLILETTAYMFPPLRRDETMVGKNQRFAPEEAARYRMLAYRYQHGEKQYQRYLEDIVAGSIPPPGLDESCMDPIDGKIRCRAGKAVFWVTWDGYMTPCGMMTSPKIDIHEHEDFISAWKATYDVSQQIKLSGICNECPNIEICHSCAAMAQTETGKLSGIPIYLCKMVDAMKEQAEKELSRHI